MPWLCTNVLIKKEALGFWMAQIAQDLVEYIYNIRWWFSER